MKKRVLSLFLILLLALSTVGIPASADDILVAGIFAKSATVTEGTFEVYCYIQTNMQSFDPVMVTVGYYTSDNILVNYNDYIVTDTQLRVLSVDIPASVASGDYVKATAMKKDTLEPVPISGGGMVVYCTKPPMDIDTAYEGMSERYYTISSAEGSLSVSKKVVSVSDEGTLFRLKDMAEGYVAFEDYTTPKYRLEYTESSGVRAYFYSAGGAKQRWIMEEYNQGYALKNANGGYLAIKDGAVTVQDEKYEWAIEYAGETPFSMMTSTDAFKLFNEEEQQRIIEICTSIGADALPYAANEKSFLDDCETVFTNVYYNKNLSDEAKKDAILTVISKPVMGTGIVSPDFETPTFPGGDAVITQTSPAKTKHVMWDLVEENGVIYSASSDHPYTGAPINCYCIDVTYTTSSSTQTVKLYCVDPGFANVQNAITAFGKIPYEYRKNVKNMYVYYSSTDSTYNLGYNPDYDGDELFVRLKGTATVEAMVESFVHELGHSLDYHANGYPGLSTQHWSQGAAWQSHIANDIVTVSGYGNSNLYENFAEFARLYWLCYSNRDYQIGIAQLYPNTFASYKRALNKIGVKALY